MHVDISIAGQTLKVMDENITRFSTPCSTSRFGLGTMEGSYQTPTGDFHIAEKIGVGAELGSQFKSRIFTGEVWNPEIITDEDLILTRILWLAGDEPHNANTQSRYLYIHGTNQEELLGSAASHGCIRLGNQAMIKLFDLVELFTKVVIREGI